MAAKHSDTVEFSCGRCGKAVLARINQGGKSFQCPDCGTTNQVPKVALAPRPSVSHVRAEREATRPETQIPVHGHTVYETSVPQRRAWIRVPATVTDLLTYLVCTWVGLSILLLILSLFSTMLSYISLILFLAVTAAVVYQIYQLMQARQRVLDQKDIPLLWGFVKLIAWDPVEGVLFLRNKAIDFFDDCLHDGQGGIRFIYPILGDELALRVPLEVQTLHIADKDVLTREYLSVTVNGTLKWRIADIRKFYLLVSRELRLTDDHARPNGVGTVTSDASQQEISGEQIPEHTVKDRIKSAIVWLRILAEEQTRISVSRVSSGLLIADKLASELPEIRAAATQDRSLLTALAASPGPSRNDEWSGTADGLARSIYDAISAKVTQYGIHIEDCSLREIKLPDEIVSACVEAAKTAYLPLLSQRKAAAQVAIKRAELAAEVELLGREAVGTREVVGAAPGFTLVDFLGEFLKKGIASHSAASAATTAALIGGIANQLPNNAPNASSSAQPKLPDA